MTVSPGVRDYSPPPMPNLPAISFEREVAPTFEQTCLAPGAHCPDGWGARTVLLRDLTRTGTGQLSAVADHDQLR